MLHQFLPLQVTYFRALPHSLGYLFQYSFLSLMILNIMHHVHDCNRVLEVRRGLVVSIVLFPPTSLKDRVITALELCSCGKEKKKFFPYNHISTLTPGGTCISGWISSVAASRGHRDIPPRSLRFCFPSLPPPPRKNGQNMPFSANFLDICPHRIAFCSLDAPTKNSSAATGYFPRKRALGF